MSAIYGIIDLKNKTDFSAEAEKFKNDYSNYAVEHIDNIVKPGAFLGCAHQYFTPEAKRDVLPVEDGDILLTADVVLDNRAELLPALQMPTDSTDGQIVLAAYKKWGKDLVKRLQGVYAFVIYDKASNEVILANDRFAQRCLFYTVRDNKVYFSTLLYPMLRCSGLSYTRNDRWLVDEISVRGPVMMMEPRETAVEGIVKVVSATYVTVALDAQSTAEANVITYYNPNKDYKVNRRITPKMSEKMIRDVMQKIEREILRSEDQIGTELSCGLDSTTVACNAAIILREQGRTLNSYTSVPLKEANLKKTGYLVFDETEGVMRVVEAYPNIHPSFIDTEGRNYLKEADYIIESWELPCKSQQNSIWSDEIYKQAAKDGCKVLLTGSTGNCTLSAGSLENSLYDHLKHFRLIKAYKSLGVASNAKASRKKVLKTLYKSVKEYKKWAKENPDFYADNLTRRDIGEKYDVANRMSDSRGHYMPFTDYKKMRSFIFFDKANAQIGEIETKSSLDYGILSRDPMRTDDMMKLCYSLPIECYSWDDYDRRLVRVGMEGIVPECIRHDIFHRGRQSGDMYYRMQSVWDTEADKIKALLEDPDTLQYLDKARIEEWFSKLSKDTLEDNQNEALMINDAYSFALYLKQLEKLLK